MRTISIAVTFVCLAVISSTGCPSSKPPGPSGAESLAGRLDAAKAITNSTTRDDALAKLATDAAAGGDAAIVKKALGEIHLTTKKDEAAAKAALKLAKEGNVDDANAVARMISITTTKDKTLEKIAKGEFGE